MVLESLLVDLGNGLLHTQLLDLDINVQVVLWIAFQVLLLRQLFFVGQHANSRI